ncbi:hypothetical protein CAPTEDRAFT_222156 [Capitella teleta]|uniref:RecA family profile 1 domain-containing protein n=1 Tax=Capitella teleta TaxID=283909 RepID=X2ASX1_CAPTE|nr:hypothetical protein CAPTEDRAFT_222156 [Capitella teleta]|eukprot:ELT88390.1 hypothetical protein CAPTEDRAFT_222156 [Capitella teleta]
MPRLTAQLSPLLTPELLEKLKQAKVRSVLDFISQDPEHLILKAGISYKEVLYLRKILMSQFSSSGLNGLELYDNVLKSVAVLPSGCASLDDLLDGGLYSMEIAEVVGSVASGKTQFCLQTALQTAANGQTVLFMDTGANFDIVRAHAMLTCKGLSEEEMETILGRIRHVHAYTASEVLGELQKAEELIESEEADSNSIRLIIIDNISAVILPILGNSTLEGHSMMSLIAKAMKSLAYHHSIALLVTNNTVTNMNQTLKPALGKAWLEVPDVRLEISGESSVQITPQGSSQRAGDSVRTCTVTKSNKMAIGKTANFLIADQGFV